jgi:hypothetical protein
MESLIDGKYFYKGEDISFDFVEVVAAVVGLIAQKEQRSFDEAYADFLASETYRKLQNTENLLWSESAEFIADEYGREVG